MGNRYSTVNAAEQNGSGSDSLFQSFTSKVFGPNSGDEVVDPAKSPLLDTLVTPSSGDSSGSGDSSLKEPTPNSSLSSPSTSSTTEDPRSITSSLPSFPGSWNEIHKVKELLPMPFDGVRATFNKGLSHHFQVSHNFALGTMQRSGYKFGATYAGTKQLSQSETFPILTGEIDPTGNLTAQCLHAFSSNTRSRLIAQHQDGQFQALEMGTDYRGANCTLAVTAANPDLLAQTGIYIGHALYAVTPNLALGVEGLFQRGMHPAIGKIASQFSGSLVTRYNSEKFNAGLQISPLELGLHASYYHKLNDNQAIGVELEGRGAAAECTSTLAYSFDIPGAECAIKASIDTSLNIATTVEKKLTPLPMTLTLSCQANQKKSQYLAGIGLSTG